MILFQNPFPTSGFQWHPTSEIVDLYNLSVRCS